MKIRVVATATYEYDTEDGLVDSVAAAIEDVESMIDSGIGVDQFTIMTEEV